MGVQQRWMSRGPAEMEGWESNGGGELGVCSLLTKTLKSGFEEHHRWCGSRVMAPGMVFVDRKSSDLLQCATGSWMQI